MKPALKDAACVACLIILCLLYFAAYFRPDLPPMEDAAMLMRYAQNLADGLGIVWNAGEDPVDGGTDFLLILVLAALVKAGLTVEAAVRAVDVTCHLLLVAATYLGAVKLGAPRWAAVISGAYLAVGPGLWYTVAYFGTPMFALIACATWALAIRLAKGGGSARASLAFAFSGLLLGLTRPDGVFLAFLMLAAVVCARGVRESRTIAAHFLAVYALLGGAYFLWRWDYFGYPLPNPFYKKGGGILHPDSLVNSLRNAFILGLPYTPLAWLMVPGLIMKKARRAVLFALIPVVGYTLIWVLLSSETNYMMRFQYPLMPVILISWPALILPQIIGSGFANRNRDRRAAAVAIIVLVFAAGLIVRQKEFHGHYDYSQPFRDGRYDVAMMLSEYGDRGYTIATTEAGLLPLYSHWRAIDAWGLNDQYIAHKGQVSELYLDLNKPEVIMVHAFFSPKSPPSADAGDRSWQAMTLVLDGYAKERGYTLAAAFGVGPQDTNYYWVRSDFPDSMEIAARIRATDYYWANTGKKAENYA
jgi:arabinofuranosyltransferase